MNGWLWFGLWLLAWLGLNSSVSEAICLFLKQKGMETPYDYDRSFFYVGFALVAATIWFAS